MPTLNYEIAQRTDRQVVMAFDQIRGDFQQGQSANVTLHFGPGIERFTASLPPPPESDQVLAEVLAANAAFTTSVEMSLEHSVSMTVIRQQNKSIDGFSVTYPDSFNRVHFARLIVACQHHLPRFHSGSTLSTVLGQEVAEFYSQREQTLRRLEGLTERLIEQNSEYRRKVDQEMTDLRQRLQTAADTDRERLRAEHETKTAELKAEQTAFAERTKELDDRRATHARRKIHADMNARLEARGKEFNLSKETVAKRRPVSRLFALLVASFAAGGFDGTISGFDSTRKRNFGSGGLIWTSIGPVGWSKRCSSGRKKKTRQYRLT